MTESRITTDDGRRALATKLLHVDVWNTPTGELRKLFAEASKALFDGLPDLPTPTPAETVNGEMLDEVADAIDAARYQHPTHPRERSRPWSEADPSDQEYARRLARAALSAIARASAPAGAAWQPIETAPKDGTDILVAGWCLHDAPGGPFADYIVAAWDVEECGGENGWSTHHGLEPIDFDPTHWMPIPARPAPIACPKCGTKAADCAQDDCPMAAPIADEGTKS